MSTANELAGQIANHLPGVWIAPERVDRPQDPHLINAATNLRLSITRENLRYRIKPDAVRVTLANGRSDWYNGAPSITVAADRTPESIARDIARRLLPDAETWHADAETWRDRTLAYDQAKTDAIAQIRNAAPWLGDIWREDTYYGRHAEVRVNGPDSVTLQIRFMGTDVALAVLRAYGATTDPTA
jgi:hypothetical protein